MQSYYSNPQQLQAAAAAAAAAIGMGGGHGPGTGHHRMQYLTSGGGGPLNPGHCGAVTSSASALMKLSSDGQSDAVADADSGEDRLNSSSSTDEHREEDDSSDAKRRQLTPNNKHDVIANRLPRQQHRMPDDVNGCSDDSSMDDGLPLHSSGRPAVTSRDNIEDDDLLDGDLDNDDDDDDDDDDDMADDDEADEADNVDGLDDDDIENDGKNVEDRPNDMASGRRNATEARGGVIGRNRQNRRRRRRLLAKLRRRQERELIERELNAAARRAAADITRRSGGEGDRRSDNNDDDQNRVLDFGAKKRSHCEDNVRGRTGYNSANGSDDEMVEQTEIKMQRPLGLLAQHGLSVKTPTMPTGGGGIRPHHMSLHGPAAGMPYHLDRTPADFEREMLQQAMHAHGAAMSLHQAAAVAAAAAQADKDGRMFGPTSGMRVDFGGGGGAPMPSAPCSAPLSLMDRRFMPSPPPNGSSTPLSCGGQDPGKMSGNGAGSPGAHHWTFEEQFKQLYEMSNDAKRKEFLDDLFSFMQKRGTPVNRIPIMAKQTLDLYELFRLVVSKGGLVEVINKKLWREITKGLNLPSSITSAAFTLRTQYMKYLYPYECEKLKLSSLGELQSAIDGNRREGRRPGYGYDFSPLPPPPVGMLTSSHLGPPSGPMGQMQMPPGTPGSSLPPHMNGGPLHPSLAAAAAASRPGSGLSAKDDECSSVGMSMMSSTGASHNHFRSLAEHDARAMEAATRAMQEIGKRMEEASRATAAAMATGVMVTGCGNPQQQQQQQQHANKFGEVAITSSSCKRPNLFEEEQRFLSQIGVPTAHLKMTSHDNGGRLNYENSSMVVSMEINGLMYQGVLFAQQPQHAHRI